MQDKYWRRYVGTNAEQEDYVTAVSRLGALWKEHREVHAISRGMSIGKGTFVLVQKFLGEHSWRTGGNLDFHLKNISDPRMLPDTRVQVSNRMVVMEQFFPEIEMPAALGRLDQQIFPFPYWLDEEFYLSARLKSGLAYRRRDVIILFWHIDKTMYFLQFHENTGLPKAKISFRPGVPNQYAFSIHCFEHPDEAS